MTNLNLLALKCRDIDSTKRFYEILGNAFDKHRHGSGPEHFASESEFGVFELYPSGELTPDNVALGFKVKQFEKTRNDLMTAGFAPGPIKENPWGTTFVVRDPDNRRVEITKAE